MRWKKWVSVIVATLVAAASLTAVSLEEFLVSANSTIGEAYFFGIIGSNQSWAVGSGSTDGGASVATIDGDAQYAVTWKLSEPAETGNSWFLAIVISTTDGGKQIYGDDGSAVDFTTDSYPDLAATLDEVYVDGEKVSVGSATIDLANYDGGAGISRIYLHDNWAGTNTTALEDCTIYEEVTAVFTISGTGQTGTSNVDDVLSTMVDRDQCFVYSTLDDGTLEVTGYHDYYNNETDVVIPSEIDDVPVTSIADYAFSDYTDLTSVVIPSTVTTIGAYAFLGCTNLTSVIIGNGVTRIESYAFYNCENLVEISIPSSMTAMESYAFGFCSSLENVYYAGTEEQWNNIKVGDSNIYFTSANIYYGVINPTDTGDLDGDCEIMVQDTYLCQCAFANVAAGKDDGLTNAQRTVADVNGDGSITVQDAYIIQRYFASAAAGNDVTWEELCE
ncbi:MAG: leucine-rich repeat protein [Ruminococcus sp.]|nr:leucine-rich repeat protein [Ruminococcus sp.]